MASIHYRMHVFLWKKQNYINVIRSWKWIKSKFDPFTQHFSKNLANYMDEMNENLFQLVKNVVLSHWFDLFLFVSTFSKCIHLWSTKNWLSFHSWNFSILTWTLFQVLQKHVEFCTVDRIRFAHKWSVHFDTYGH